jgi:hypothetical protein
VSKRHGAAGEKRSKLREKIGKGVCRGKLGSLPPRGSTRASSCGIQFKQTRLASPFFAQLAPQTFLLLLKSLRTCQRPVILLKGFKSYPSGFAFNTMNSNKISPLKIIQSNNIEGILSMKNYCGGQRRTAREASSYWSLLQEGSFLRATN